jgi:hypothetical protein
MSKIFDCFIFNDEIDLLKIRLAYLSELDKIHEIIFF